MQDFTTWLDLGGVYWVEKMIPSLRVFCSTKCRNGLGSLYLVQRFCQPRRTRFCNYTGNSSKYSSRQGSKHPVMLVETDTSSSWPTYAIPAAVVGGIAGVALLIHYNDERRVIRKGEGGTPEAISAKGPIIGGPFTLTDTENRVMTEKDLLGNWVLMYFGYTSSPDVGPEQLSTMDKALEIIGDKQKSRILPVFVTIDPQRDKPSHLRAYLREFNPGIIGLTGPVNAIRQMAQEYRVYFKKIEEEGDDYLVDSSHNMYLLNPNMEIVRMFGLEYTAEQLSESILAELKRSNKSTAES